jgi:hypothetical protein
LFKASSPLFFFYFPVYEDRGGTMEMMLATAIAIAVVGLLASWRLGLEHHQNTLHHFSPANLNTHTKEKPANVILGT